MAKIVFHQQPVATEKPTSQYLSWSQPARLV